MHPWMLHRSALRQMQQDMDELARRWRERLAKGGGT